MKPDQFQELLAKWSEGLESLTAQQLKKLRSQVDQQVKVVERKKSKTKSPRCINEWYVVKPRLMDYRVCCDAPGVPDLALPDLVYRADCKAVAEVLNAVWNTGDFEKIRIGESHTTAHVQDSVVHMNYVDTLPLAFRNSKSMRLTGLFHHTKNHHINLQAQLRGKRVPGLEWVRTTGKTVMAASWLPQLVNCSEVARKWLNNPEGPRPKSVDAVHVGTIVRSILPGVNYTKLHADIENWLLSIEKTKTPATFDGDWGSYLI